jgi:RNA polymerase sigma-70 factor (ECF subfamily)
MEQFMAKQTETNLTEAEAIKQAKDGGAAAFEYPYKLHCGRVYGVCLRIIKNPAEAEDLTQHAFLQLFRKIGTFRGESGFSTWLHRVTVNSALMHLRQRKRKKVLCDGSEQHGADDNAQRELASEDTPMLGVGRR